MTYTAPLRLRLRFKFGLYQLLLLSFGVSCFKPQASVSQEVSSAIKDSARSAQLLPGQRYVLSLLRLLNRDQKADLLEPTASRVVSDKGLPSLSKAEVGEGGVCQD